MKKHSIPVLTLTLSLSAVLAVGTACSEKKPAAEEKTAESEAPAVPSGPAYPAEAQAPVDEALAAYEEARLLFVADKAEGIDVAAQKMAAAAEKAQESAPEAAKAHLKGIAEAAKALDAEMKEGIEPARKVYGDISKHVVSLLVAFPSLIEGRYVFDCPMAPGYRKWVQADPAIANPYMGQRMLRCGGPTDWKV